LVLAEEQGTVILPTKLVYFGEATCESLEVCACDVVRGEGLVVKVFPVLFGEFGNLFVQNVNLLIFL
jgi:hypothetical protein